MVIRRLIGRLPPGSRLSIAEVKPCFAARLRTLAVHDPRLRRTSIQAQVHQTRDEYLDASRQYDVIVSGLPLTNFIPDQVEKTMNRYLDTLYPAAS